MFVVSEACGGIVGGLLADCCVRNAPSMDCGAGGLWCRVRIVMPYSWSSSNVLRYPVVCGLRASSLQHHRLQMCLRGRVRRLAFSTSMVECSDGCISSEVNVGIVVSPELECSPISNARSFAYVRFCGLPW